MFYLKLIPILAALAFSIPGFAAELSVVELIAGKTTPIKVLESGADISSQYVLSSKDIELFSLMGKTMAIGKIAGSRQITGTHKTDSSKNKIFNVAVKPGAASMIVAETENGLSGVAGQEISKPISVKAVDRFKNGVPGIKIVWSSVKQTDALIDGVQTKETITGEDGTSKIKYKLGSHIGVQSVKAQGPSSLLIRSAVSISFNSLEAPNSDVKDLIVELGTKSVLANSKFNVSVTLKNALGATYSGPAKSVSIAAYKNSSCSIPTTVQLTGTTTGNSVNGVVNFSGLSFPESAFVYIGASFPGLPTACSSVLMVQNLSAVENFTLELSPPPRTITVGASLPSIKVVAKSPNGTRLFKSIPVSISAYADAACSELASVPLTGVTQKTAILGATSFLNLSYSTPSTIYLKASSGNISSACSVSLEVKTDTRNIPKNLVFSPFSTSATAHTPFLGQPKVHVVNEFGHKILSVSYPIKLKPYSDSLCSVPALGMLGAINNPVITTGGTATFSGVGYSRVEKIYLKAELDLDGEKISACSPLVDVGSPRPGIASKVLILSAPSTVDANTAVSTPVSIEIRDTYNKKYSASLPFSVSIHSDSGCLDEVPSITPKTSVTNNGVGSIILSNFNSSGSYFIKATSMSLEPACSPITINGPYSLPNSVPGPVPNSSLVDAGKGQVNYQAKFPSSKAGKEVLYDYTLYHTSGEVEDGGQDVSTISLDGSSSPPYSKAFLDQVMTKYMNVKGKDGKYLYSKIVVEITVVETNEIFFVYITR